LILEGDTGVLQGPVFGPPPIFLVLGINHFGVLFGNVFWTMFVHISCI